jgi:hypothetical protein
MKSINYALIFLLSAVLTVACGGGGGGGGGGTEAVSATTISNSVTALSAAFAPVAF